MSNPAFNSPVHPQTTGVFHALRTRFLNRFLTPAPRPAKDTPAARRPVAFVESLERRDCPSVTVAVGHFTGHNADDIHITGADNGQHIVITEDPLHNSTTVQIDANGNGLFTGPGDFNQTFPELFGQIKVNVKGGTGDTVDYHLASDLSAANRDFRLRLGTGANTFNFDAQGHAITNNTLLTFEVSSKNNSAQNINFSFGAIDNSEVDTGVALGSGAHNVKLNYDGPIQNNSLVNTDVLLGNGNHNVAVNLVGNISASSVHIKTTGGDDAAGHDNVAYYVGAAVSNDSLLDIGMTLGKGDDTGAINVSQSGFAAFDTSRVFFTIDGGDGNDTITYGSVGTGTAIPVEGLVDALLIGGRGDDTINVNFPATNAIDLTGTFRLEADGNSGNDHISAFLSNTINSNGSYDVQLFGNAGNDTFALTNNDPTGMGVLYNQFGFDLVAGGAGFNVATLIGPDIDARRISG